MPAEINTRPPKTQDGEVHRPLAPYPLTPATVAMWMRRGERLGHMLRLVAIALPLLALIGRWQQRQQKR